jgi:CoA:oxalate CoA-transferase
VTALGPLSGITVVEMTSNLSGPYAGMLLADQGALVLKIERPGGDETRRIPPYYIQGDSVYFAAVNRNKRAIAVDARHSEGADLIRRLVSAGQQERRVPHQRAPAGDRRARTRL